MKYSQIAPHHHLSRCPICLRRLKRLNTEPYPRDGYDDPVLRVGCRNHIEHFFDIKTTRLISSHVILEQDLLKVFRNLDQNQTVIFQLERKTNQLLLAKIILEIDHPVSMDMNDIIAIRQKIKLLLTLQ